MDDHIMPELRKDPVVDRWVIIAAQRGKRPTDFQGEQQIPSGSFCPFCEGNEDATPDEIIAYRKPGTHANRAGWRVRVIPNNIDLSAFSPAPAPKNAAPRLAFSGTPG